MRFTSYEKFIKNNVFQLVPVLPGAKCLIINCEAGWEIVLMNKLFHLFCKINYLGRTCNVLLQNWWSNKNCDIMNRNNENTVIKINKWTHLPLGYLLVLFKNKFNLWTHVTDWFHEHGLKWMSQNTFVDKSTLDQVMAYCCQAVSHHLS